MAEQNTELSKKKFITYSTNTKSILLFQSLKCGAARKMLDPTTAALPRGVPVPPRGLLGLQELRLHAGHLTEVLGVCLWALHLTPADGHHLHPCGHAQSADFLPAYSSFTLPIPSSPRPLPEASEAQQWEERRRAFAPRAASAAPHVEMGQFLPASLRATTTPSSFSAVLSR